MNVTWGGLSLCQPAFVKPECGTLMVIIDALLTQVREILLSRTRNKPTAYGHMDGLFTD